MQPKHRKMSTEKFTTRQQLRGYGASRYQSEAITKNLTSVAKQSGAYAYALTDVITSIRTYLQSPRIKPATRQTLEAVLEALMTRLGNVTEVPFGRGTDLEINKLAKQLSCAMSNTDGALAELKATAAAIKAKYN